MANPKANVIRTLALPDIEVISSHAFSADGNSLALCANNEEIRLFKLQGNDFESLDSIKKHTLRVTGLSWSKDGRLLSCSEDRTAYVWTYVEATNTWKAGIVELRAARAALCCAWSPVSERFAVGLASKEVAICSYDANVSCWICTRKLGKHKASVMSLCWHPQAAFLATGSTDRQWMVVDTDDGAVQIQEDTGSWVNAVAFSPSGKTLAITPQDSSVRFKDLGGDPNAPCQRVQWRRMPFLRAAFVNDQALVCCGFDNIPVLFALSGSTWQAIGSLDATPQANPAQEQGAFAGALNKFKDLKISEHNSKHKNTITGLSVLGPKRFATTSLDGQLFVWDIDG